MQRQEPSSSLRRAWRDPDSQLAADDDFVELPPDEIPLPKQRPLIEPEEFTQIEPAHGKKKPALDKRFSLLSGADLMARQADTGPRFAPHLFKHGMSVLHPEHGLGTIVALGGEGPKRTATVHFAKEDRERRFFLIHSKLEPVNTDT